MNDVIKAALVDGWQIYPPPDHKAVMSAAWSQLVPGTKCLVRRETGEYLTFEYMYQDKNRLYSRNGSVPKKDIERLWVIGLPPDPFDPLRKKVNDVLMEALYPGGFLRHRSDTAVGTTEQIRRIADKIVDEVLMTDDSVPGVKASDRYTAITEALDEVQPPRAGYSRANTFHRALRKRGWTVVEDV